MLDHGPAGAGAREVHARRQDARLRRLQEAGCSAEELTEAIEHPPAHETAWLVGADGEARVGQVLQEWAQATGFALLIDATPPGRSANLDFITVGAGGAVVVDAKAWTGKLRFARDSVWIGRYGKRKDLAAVVGQAQQVADVLAANGLDVPVRAMLCMANDNDGLPTHGLVAAGEVSVGNADAVARAIGGGGPLAPETIDQAAAVLCDAFVLRGFVPRSEPVLSVLPAAPEPRVRRRSLRWVRRLVVAAACVFGLAHLGEALRAPDPAPPLATAEVRAALPQLRAKARKAAGGPVHGPAWAASGDAVRLSFRRGACRVLVRVDRSAATVAAGATVTPGRRCPPPRRAR